jgi:hypothetical protein
MVLMDYPEAIADLRHRMLRLDEELIQQEETQSVFAVEIEKIVLSDETLTNEAKRKARRLDLQQIVPEYAGVSARIKELRLKRQTLEIELELLRNQFRAIQLLMEKQIAETQASGVVMSRVELAA